MLSREPTGPEDPAPRQRRSRWPSLVALLPLLLWATPALAYGPAEHRRECFRTAELLSGVKGPLGQLTDPALRPWLGLGCVAPDFRQASAALSAVDTHSWKLGLHLLKAAQLPEAPTGAVAFAVGHLAHHASDGAESVYAAALAASGLLGAPDLFAGTSDEGFGECEMWVEVLGEFANGDLAALVDLLASLGAFGQATVNWQAMLTWYVQQANLWSGSSAVDPAKVVAEIGQVLAKAKTALAGFEAESVQVLLDTLKSGTPASAVQLMAKLPIGDALQAFGIQMGSGLDPLRWRPLAKLPVFASFEPWHALYAPPFGDMGPQWTADLAQTGKHDPTWPPSHNSLAMQAGARMSLAWGMPAGTFAPQHAVLADELGFFHANGQPAAAWQPGGGPLTVRARLFASQPVKTWVALRVHLDPGTVAAVDLGALVTATTALLSVDPKEYFKSAERLTLQTVFDVPQGAQRGLVLALARGSSPQEALASPPFLHGNWTLYQAHNLLDVTGPVYDPHHHTYAGWPRGVRLPDPPSPKSGSIVVRVLEAPAGNLLPKVQADVRALAADSGLPVGPVLAKLEGTAGGRLLADGLKPPGVGLVLTGLFGQVAGRGSDGWPLPLAVTTTVVAGEVTHFTTRAWVLPKIEAATWEPASPLQPGAAPQPGAKANVQVHLAPLGHFGDQPMRLELRLAPAQFAAPAWPKGPSEYVVDLLQTGPEDADPAHFRYTLSVDADLLTPPDAGKLEGNPLFVQARLHYVAAKAGPAAQDHRGPWVALALKPAAAAVALDALDASEPADTGDDSQAQAEAGDASLDAVAAHSAAAQPDGGCSAAAGKRQASLGELSLLVLMAGWLSLRLVRRRPSGRTTLALFVIVATTLITAAPAHAGNKCPLNAEVVAMVATYPDRDHGESLWPPAAGTHGTTRDLKLGKQVIARAGKGTYCVGVTLEILWRVLEAQPGGVRGAGLTTGRAKRLLRLWFVPKQGGRGAAEALPKLGLGRALAANEEVMPGDFVQFWGWQAKWGHSAIFLGWLKDARGQVTGMRFWSSQVWTHGIGTAAMVIDAKAGAIDPKRIYFARLEVPAPET